LLLSAVCVISISAFIFQRDGAFSILYFLLTNAVTVRPQPVGKFSRILIAWEFATIIIRTIYLSIFSSYIVIPQLFSNSSDTIIVKPDAINAAILQKFYMIQNFAVLTKTEKENRMITEVILAGTPLYIAEEAKVLTLGN